MGITVAYLGFNWGGGGGGGQNIFGKVGVFARCEAACSASGSYAFARVFGACSPEKIYMCVIYNNNKWLAFKSIQTCKHNYIIYTMQCPPKCNASLKNEK